MSNEIKVFRFSSGVHDDYLTAMRRGFKGEDCKKGMMKLSKRLAKDLHEKNISVENANFVLKKTGENSEPKMSEIEVYLFWEKVVLAEKEELDKEKEKEEDMYIRRKKRR